MNLGTLPINALYLGSTPISRIMLGTVEVWSSETPPALASINYSFDITEGNELLEHEINLAWSGGGGVTTVVLSAGINSYVFTGLLWNELYDLDNNALGEVPSPTLSVSVYTAPQFPPSDFLATSNGENSITLTLTENASTPLNGGYEFRRSTDGLVWTVVGEIPTGEVEFESEGLAGETEYRHQVRAFNNNPGYHARSYSDWSASSIATTDADITIPIVSAVSAVAGDTTAVGKATSNESGNLYFYFVASATEPDPADLMDGTGADYATDEVCVGGVEVEVNATGLTNEDAYHLFVMAEDLSGNLSAISTVGPFTPEEAFNVLALLPVLWLDASDGSTLLDDTDSPASDGELIETWVDKSGYGNHAIQASSNKPKRAVAEQNGLDALWFDVIILSRMAFASAPLTGATAAFVAFVARRDFEDAASGYEAMSPLIQWGTAGDPDLYPWSNGTIYDGLASTVRKEIANPSSPLASAQIVSIISASGDYRYRMGGVELYSTASNSVGIGSTPKLGGDPSNDWQFPGHIMEIIALDYIPDSGVIADIETYLSRWIP